MQTASLTLTRSQHDELLAHLFSPDGCEAVAIALCGLRHGNDRLRLLMQEITPIPYEACSDRQPHRVTWPTHVLPPLLEKARRRGLAVLKIHGHESPFSTIDDHADRALFPSVHAWTDGDSHGSAIAYPDGRMKGRLVDSQGAFRPLLSVNVVGDDLSFWPSAADIACVPEFARRVAQTFGAGTYDRLHRLRIAVIGCSGTGSPLKESLPSGSIV